jgi:predicted O-methyltransferase YrrM
MRKIELNDAGAPLIAAKNNENSLAREAKPESWLNGPALIQKGHPWKDEFKPWLDYPWKKTKMHSMTECHYFYRAARALAQRNPDANCLSLGAYKGLSSACLAYGLQAAQGTGRVYAVDLFNHDGNQHESFDVGIIQCSLEKYVTACHGYTQDWAPRFLQRGLLFSFILIDADHNYETCKLDFELYSQLLAPGGLIAFHDVDFLSVGTVISEIDKTQWKQADHIYRLKVFNKRR